MKFFEDRGHTPVPSASLLPADDPTLLFTNSGMNQFKEIFLGTASRDYVRAVNTQKCIRAGGKHNDLEDIGHSIIHHTFFEMLGNWSFGDYFKAEAIEWAWQLLTDVWAMPKDRLYATVFAGDAGDGLEADDEAGRLWAEVTDIDPSHILTGSKKDNFWEMGATGPCGPCSEIHIDLTDDGSGLKLVNAGDPRVLEIWNLVFIQYNRAGDAVLSPLPAKHVDTGLGLERIAMVLQGKKSNYATDLFVAIIRRIETLTDHRYGASSGLKDRFNVGGDDDIGDVACRVIADHARSLTFAIADGIIPANEGRGYVVRRILRRAARYGRQYLHMEGPFLVKLVETVVDLMADVFPEIRQRQRYVADMIRQEEQSFGRTLDRGIELFQRQADKLTQQGRTVLPGEVAFDLYATYGFPVDLTGIMAAECGLTVDTDGYDSAMARHRELSGTAAAFKAEAIANLPPCDDSAKYSSQPIQATVSGWVQEGRYLTGGALSVGDEAAVVLNCTNFYGESGGQVGDGGHLVWPGGKFTVRDTRVVGDCVLHVGVVAAGTLAVGQHVRCGVDPARMDTMRNHTATHLLHWALREVLGQGVNQAGSEVGPERLRFDFSHSQALEPEELDQVERLVNGWILADKIVSTNVMPLAEARKIDGARAMFGEKYDQEVRVVSIGTDDPRQPPEGDRTVEFCGGTHMKRTGAIGLFKSISEESVAKGVRRITAVTGDEAVRRVQEFDRVVKGLSAVLKTPLGGLVDRVTAMQKEIKELRRRPAGAGGSGALETKAEIESPHGKILIGRTESGQAPAMRNLCDQQRQKGAAAVFLGGVDGQKVVLVAMVCQELVDAVGIRAGEWVKAVAPVVGGGGGGKATMAQAGGRDPAKLDQALALAADWIGPKVR